MVKSQESGSQLLYCDKATENNPKNNNWVWLKNKDNTRDYNNPLSCLYGTACGIHIVYTISEEEAKHIREKQSDE
jgi:hypothetical protein